jgi:preprotein translocase subunit SecA
MPETWQSVALDRCQAVRRRVNELTAEKQQCGDSELRSQSDELRRRRSEGDESDDLLSEALAVSREAYARTLGESISDVELMAATAMCAGMIAELPNPEARRSAAMLAAYWRSLGGHGVHVVAQSDYLAERDAFPMSAIGTLLGVRVGLVTNGSTLQERRAAYASDVTFGSYLELMWDYLRDGLRDDPAEVVERGLQAAIVGDADAILVDFANLPATITVPSEARSASQGLVVRASSALRRGEHYQIHGGDVRFTRAGLIALAKKSGKGSLESLDASFAQRVESLVRQHEGLPRQDERRVYSSVSVRAFFRCYETIVGLTAWADAIADQVEQVYGVRCLQIAAEERATEGEHPDAFYASDNARLSDLARRVADEHANGRSVLIGATSAGSVDRICASLERRGIQPRRLSSGRPSEVIGRAGQRGAVTVLDITAHRPDQITLGGDVGLLTLEALRRQGMTVAGNDLDEWVESYRAARAEVTRVVAAERAQVLAAGGLAAFGVGRSSSRPANDWLRNRVGEPGDTWFLLSAEDPHLAGLKFGWSGPTLRLRARQATTADDRTAHGARLKREIAGRDARAEMAITEERLESWRYEWVLESQRLQVRSLRRDIREADDTRSLVMRMIGQLVDDTFNDEDVDSETALKEIKDVTGRGAGDVAGHSSTHSCAWIKDQIHLAYSSREREVSKSIMRGLERKVLLTDLDLGWYEQLNWLRFAAVHARELYADSDVLSDYHRDSSNRYLEMMKVFRRESLKYLFRMDAAQAN